MKALPQGDPKYYSCYCLLTNKTGMIYLGEKRVFYDAGALLISIMKIPSCIIDDLLSITLQLEDCISNKLIDKFADIVTGLPDVMTHSNSIDIKSLLFLVTVLPALQLYHPTLHDINQIKLSDTEKEKYLSNVPTHFDGSPDYDALDQRLRDFSDRTAYLNDALFYSEKVYKWVRVLVGECNVNEIESEYIAAFSDVLEDYLFALRREIRELRTLHDDMTRYFKNGAGDLTCELEIDAKVVYPPYAFTPPAPIYEVYSSTSLTTLAALDIRNVTLTTHHLRQCRLCKQYFISKRRDAEYCNNPNSSYSDRPCNRVGAQLQFSERESASLLGSEYRKRYNSYTRWINEQKKHRIPILKGIIFALTNGSRDEKKAYTEREISSMTDEIETIFGAWNNSAKKAADECTPSTLSECRALLELPSVQDRGPKLAEWTSEMKKSEGIV